MLGILYFLSISFAIAIKLRLNPLLSCYSKVCAVQNLICYPPRVDVHMETQCWKLLANSDFADVLRHKVLVSWCDFVLVLSLWVMHCIACLQEMVESLVKAKSSESNIVLVEWEPGASQTYPQSVANTRVVGTEMAQLLRLARVSVFMQGYL